MTVALDIRRLLTGGDRRSIADSHLNSVLSCAGCARQRTRSPSRECTWPENSFFYF